MSMRRRAAPGTHARGQGALSRAELPDGKVLEILGNPMPGGGFVTSYSDVTAYKRAQRALQEANETLEDRLCNAPAS